MGGTAGQIFEAKHQPGTIAYSANLQLEMLRETVAERQNVPAAARPSKPGVDGHAGEVEIGNVMASRPDLAHPARAGEQSGRDLNRLICRRG